LHSQPFTPPQEIRELQEQFKALHQSLEASKQEFPEPEQMRKAISRRENDKASLATRIVKAKDKAETCAPTCTLERCRAPRPLQPLHPITRVSNYAELAPLCRELRVAQDALAELTAELTEERGKSKAFELQHHRAAAKLAELRATLSDGSGTAALERLRREAAVLRENVHVALPK